jgi:outer membrane protein OmpA-like peptidoglycan-associated protein
LAQGCLESYKPVLDSAFKSNNIASLNRLLSNEQLHADCSVEWVDSVRLKATQVVANEAENRLLAGDLQSAESLLLGDAEASFALSAYWSVNAVLGDIARHREQWKQAAQQYGEAYELASADTKLAQSDAARSEAIQMQLFRLSNESLRLSKDLSVAISRSGNGSGALSSRGFKPVAIPLPVTFEFDSARLDSGGVEQATLIANYIATQNLDTITLTGHTDWKGCAAYNRELSEKRAIELASAVNVAYENNTGKQITINTQGAGESCPPVLSNASSYSESQREDLARRVEIQLQGAPAELNQGMCDLQSLVEDESGC